MAAMLFMVLTSVWFAALVPQSAATTPTPVSHVSLSVTPDPSFSAGFTNNLAVNCSFNLAPGADFHTIMSLILSKADPIRDRAAGYSEIVSITSFDRHTAEIKGGVMGASISGVLSPVGQSFVALDWKNPPAQVEGEYLCIAHGMDKDGHPRVMQTTAHITEKPVDMAMLLQRLQDMARVQQQLKDQLNKSQAAQLGGSCGCQSDLLDHTRDAMMEADVVYNGHRYFLSQRVIFNQAQNNAQCRMFGGYLAEMDDQQEYDFVLNNFTNANDPENYYIALGASDKHHEGNWTLLESGKEMSFVDWRWGDPNGGLAENCLYWAPNMNGMFSWVCEHVSWGRFLCEVPLCD